jgi:RNA methyltransferase, RsmE family
VRIHRIYCKSVSKPDKRFFLDDSESNHLIKALRLKENSQVEVFDGNGNSCLCKIIKYSSKLCELEKLGDLKFDHQPKNILSVVIPLIKRTNFNFMIQKLTEIGVNNFMIYKAEFNRSKYCKKGFIKNNS